MNPPKRFYPLTPEQRAAVLRRIDAAELAEFRPEQWSSAEPPSVSEGTASVPRLQDAMRTGGLRLVPMSDVVEGNARPRHAAARAQQQHRPAMTEDRYRLDDGIPVLRVAAGEWRARPTAEHSTQAAQRTEPAEWGHSTAGAATVLAVIFAVCIAGVVAITLLARAG
ncbi:hypothetical protein KBW71_02145 [Hydrogenophaga aromaticivorans]|uniref:hypothetical protein n=1 Tax=Hydrogenophaga aromaticivorans TaxID=2610898 RepID=UPI001B3829CD|nr:hypothetical protein [Hydrogenophaga aromaticivorans]MBQ0917232.1 hypothetical protein [Hydrogenophaga aromaticivorans]